MLSAFHTIRRKTARWKGVGLRIRPAMTADAAQTTARASPISLGADPRVGSSTTASHGTVKMKSIDSQ
jgi:hypothetical protein